MSKIKKLPQRVKELKKKEAESNLEKELDNEIKIEDSSIGINSSNLMPLSPTLKHEGTLEEISRQSTIIVEEEKESEETRFYDEKAENLYDSDNSSDDRTYNANNSQEKSKKTKRDNFQERNTVTLSKTQMNEERNNLTDTRKHEYNLRQENKRNYLM